MDVDTVPQEINPNFDGHSKAMYARDTNGHIVVVPSVGWEAEAIVTTHAVDTLHTQAQAARQRAQAGLTSPLEYWMYACRMDLALLAQTSGFWQWQVRRHLQPTHFARLSTSQRARYADALGLTPDQLSTLPS